VTARQIPTFDELPTLPGESERHGWDVWGREDQLGAVNFIGPEQVVAAAGLVRTGEIIPLSLPLNEPSPGIFERRTEPEHVITMGPRGRDDHLDGLWLQFSSQWDGLRHVRYRKHGYYGGRSDEEVDRSGALGIERWAQHGLIGRGVLLDAVHYFEVAGSPLVPDEHRPITAADLDAIAAAQGTEVLPGDIVMVRTGWLEWFLDLPYETRTAMRGTVGTGERPLASPGLDAHRETVAWLWNHRVAAIAADNLALESLPVDREVGFMHYRLIPLLGLAVGELWSLADLAVRCEAIGRYEFLFTSGVLPLTGGVGSPTNAYAVV
jgi:kynurenine formamidase